MYSYSFLRFEGGVMDLPAWYFNVSFGALVVVVLLSYQSE